jgi:hypothetical protein
MPLKPLQDCWKASVSPTEPCPTLLSTPSNNNAITVNYPGGSIIVTLAPGISPNLQYYIQNTCSVTATITWTLVSPQTPEGISDSLVVGPGKTVFTPIFFPADYIWDASFAIIT